MSSCIGLTVIYLVTLLVSNVVVVHCTVLEGLGQNFQESSPVIEIENIANQELNGESLQEQREGRQFQDELRAPNPFISQPQTPQPSFRDISGAGGFGGFANQPQSVSSP